MEFLNVVGSRRSIRWYRAWDPVPREKIQRVLEAARMCTSVGNLQPWRAVVVERDSLDDATRDELLKADNWQGGHVQAPVWIYWFADPTVALPENFLRSTVQLLQAEAAPREYGWNEETLKGAIESAETAPEGMAPIHEWHSMPPELGAAMAAQETNGAAVVACLAAQNEGLGTSLHVLSKPSMTERVKEILGVPPYCVPVWVQLLGWPAENPNGGGQRPREDFGKLFYLGRWGVPMERDPKVVEELRTEGLIQPEAPLPGRTEEHRYLARMYGYAEV